MSSTTATAQQAIKTKRGWHETLPLPKIEQAKLYRRVLKGLGYRTRAPQERESGFVIRYRPLLQRERG
ncbi:hypothetical protein CIG75_19170 [Tumebacillus algifaecis]|uniref:Uncharacterized protein n=1 Tax=Tumebacillus algifaecis TaxID=1214604 RepID=A0A223D5M6_9BACL|nr:hypothetical protein CIG75_19170 [Tumebacillus algifaecis]